MQEWSSIEVDCERAVMSSMTLKYPSKLDYVLGLLSPLAIRVRFHPPPVLSCGCDRRIVSGFRFWAAKDLTLCLSIWADRSGVDAVRDWRPALQSCHFGKTHPSRIGRFSRESRSDVWAWQERYSLVPQRETKYQHGTDDDHLLTPDRWSGSLDPENASSHPP